MKVFKSTKDIQDFRKQLRKSKIGFVPTMGNLHLGHLSLIKNSVLQNDYTFISIFVNPSQFGPNEDFEKYPRTLKKDIALIEKEFSDSLEKIFIFAPNSVNEVYPKGFSTSINISGFQDKLCSKNRPTHFNGVATVCYSLFQIIKPDNAYFGQKDYQQLLVIKKMVKDLRLEINIKSCPIKRDEKGLALSSRNQYLNETERKEALILSENILKISSSLQSSGLNEAIKTLEKLKSQNEFEYLEILNAENLELPNENNSLILVAGALKLGQTRLIDNNLVVLNA